MGIEKEQMTEIQTKTLYFITNYIKDKGHPPSLRTIYEYFRREFNYSSLRTVELHLRVLQKKGYIFNSGNYWMIKNSEKLGNETYLTENTEWFAKESFIPGTKLDANCVSHREFLISKNHVSRSLYESVASNKQIPTKTRRDIGNNLTKVTTSDDSSPADNISWYEAIEFCNDLSAMHGLQQVYKIDKSKNDPENMNSCDEKKWSISIDLNANGYRLPTSEEWLLAFNSEIYRECFNVQIWDWCWDWDTEPKAGLKRIFHGPENKKLHSNYCAPDSRSKHLGLRLVRRCEDSLMVSVNDGTIQMRIPFEEQNVRNHQMIFVKGGTFQMGSINGVTDEEPLHSVTLSDFLIANYPVTQALWKYIMEVNPSKFTGDDNLPVEQVSWYDAVEFCNKLSEKEGLHKVYNIIKSRKDPDNNNEHDNVRWLVYCDFTVNGYRLPTEAEWEYAARGGSLSKNYTYSGSDNADDVAWYDKNSVHKTHPVGGPMQPNELGIYNMSGNVWEWCWDWYGKYSAESQLNPSGPPTGIDRVCRGGSKSYFIGGLRPANRGNYPPNDKGDFLGFRIVRSK